MNNEENIVDVEPTTVEEKQPSLGEGNYIVEAISNGKVIRKVLIVNSAINITKLDDGGLTVDLP